MYLSHKYIVTKIVNLIVGRTELSNKNLMNLILNYNPNLRFIAHNNVNGTLLKGDQFFYERRKHDFTIGESLATAIY